MTDLSFENLKKLIDEHFDGMSDEEFELSLERAGYSFYKNIEISLFNGFIGSARASSNSREFSDLIFKEFAAANDSCIACNDYDKAA